MYFELNLVFIKTLNFNSYFNWLLLEIILTFI